MPGPVRSFPRKPLLWGVVALSCACSRSEQSSKRHAVDAVLAAVQVDAAVEHDDGSVVQCLVQAANPNTQVVKAPAKSSIAGAFLAFPPGAIGLDSSVTLGSHASLATAANLAKLTTGTTSLKGSAVAIGVTFAYDINTLSTYNATLPAPAGSGNLAVIGLENVPGSDSAVLVLIPASELKPAGAFVTAALQSYGIYQAVYLSQVSAAASVTVVKPPPVSTVSTGSAPGDFAILGPLGPLSPARPTVSWAAAPQADAYDVKLDAKDPACGAPLKDYPAVTGTSLKVDAADGVNYVCVWATNAAGSTAASNSGFKFTASTTLPPAPAKPTSDPVTDGVSATFHWSAGADVVPAVVAYVLQVGTTAGAADQFNGTLPTTSKEILGLAGKTYYARVAAVDAAGNQSAWSPVSDGVPFN